MTKMTVTVANATYFKNNHKIVAALNDIDNLSRFLRLQLVEKGYLEIVKEKKTAGRGRANHVYQLTSKAKNLIRLSAGWVKKAEAAEAV